VGTSSVKCTKPPPVSGWGSSLMPVCVHRGTAPGAAAAAPGRGASGRTVTHQLLGARSRRTFHCEIKRPVVFPKEKRRQKRRLAPVTGDFFLKGEKKYDRKEQVVATTVHFFLSFLFLLQLPQVAELELRPCGKIGFDSHFFAWGQLW